MAHTARDAMQTAPRRRRPSDTPIDLVLLDLGLPDASGIALASALAGLRPAPDIIAITSERDLEMVRAAVAHGALAYLLKPFTFAAFRDRLERYRRYRSALPAGRRRRQPGRGRPRARRIAGRRGQVGVTEGRGRPDQRRHRAGRARPNRTVRRPMRSPNRLGFRVLPRGATWSASPTTVS